jgi:acyl dehydratase
MHRLSGDYNPLHSDPEFAAAMGLSQPILHGLCTLGIAARVIVAHFCSAEPQCLQSIQCRFTKPVFPGDTLEVSSSLVHSVHTITLSSQ